MRISNAFRQLVRRMVEALVLRILRENPWALLRQAESERDTAFRAAAGVLTKNDRPVVMILRPGDICRDGDLYVSSLEGGTYAADVGKKISDSYHMPHFRPITPLRVGWHWRRGC